MQNRNLAFVFLLLELPLNSGCLLDAFSLPQSPHLRIETITTIDLHISLPNSFLFHCRILKSICIIPLKDEKMMMRPPCSFYSYSLVILFYTILLCCSCRRTSPASTPTSPAPVEGGDGTDMTVKRRPVAVPDGMESKRVIPSSPDPLHNK